MSKVYILFHKKNIITSLKYKKENEINCLLFNIACCTDEYLLNMTSYVVNN